MNPATSIGIDVAKARLDVAVRPSGEQWVSGTDGASLDGLVGRLQTLQPELIVLEATGGRAGSTVAALAAAGGGRFAGRGGQSPSGTRFRPGGGSTRQD